MEGLAPPLKCLLEVKLDLLNGESLKSSLLRYIKNHSDEFSFLVQIWMFHYEQGKSFQAHMEKVKSPYRRILIEVFELGIEGQPILKRLEELKLEMMEACQSEIDLYLSRLPFLSLFPLFFFQFPAFLLLMLGPVILELVQSLK